MLTQFGFGELTPKQEILQRISNLKQEMAHSAIDFCVILGNVNLFYFTGTTQKGVLIVPLEDKPLFFVQRSVDRAKAESPLQVIPIASDKEIGRLKEKGVFRGRGGMEFDVVPVSLFDRYTVIMGSNDLVDVSGIIKKLRSVKSTFELEQIRKSGAICDRVHAKAREVIKEGLREIDIETELDREGRKAGHQGSVRIRGFNQEMRNMYVVAGYTGAVPSAGDAPVCGVGVTPAMSSGSSVQVIKKGTPVIVDYGAAYNGYITDETRTYVVGEPDDVFKRPYETAREIVEDTHAFAKEGTDCTQIFERASYRVNKENLQDYFMGFGPTRVTYIGHGLGLEINEMPVITRQYHIMLKEGMVFALEPKFIFPGLGAIGVEVDFIVGKEGLERVTKGSTHLVQL